MTDKLYRQLRKAQSVVNSASSDKQLKKAKIDFDKVLKKVIKK